MEDILASIRRILNDDEVAPESAALEEPAPSPQGEDVFLLDQTMLIEAPADLRAEAPPDTHRVTQAVPEPIAHMPEPEIETSSEPDPEPGRLAAEPPSLVHTDVDEPLLAPSAAAAATASLGALVRVVGQQQTPIHRGGGVTLEDMVRDEIRPLVKTWLDENLAPMVERMVRAEIARVTGGK